MASVMPASVHALSIFILLLRTLLLTTEPNYARILRKKQKSNSQTLFYMWHYLVFFNNFQWNCKELWYLACNIVLLTSAKMFKVGPWDQKVPIRESLLWYWFLLHYSKGDDLIFLWFESCLPYNDFLWMFYFSSMAILSSNPYFFNRWTWRLVPTLYSRPRSVDLTGMVPSLLVYNRSILVYASTASARKLGTKLQTKKSRILERIHFYSNA